MHPLVMQALAAERAKDMRARAAARDLARTAHRRGHHTLALWAQGTPRQPRPVHQAGCA